MAQKENSYDEAFAELQSIMNDLQADDISVDNLSAKVKRASELLKFCHTKLRDTELEVSELIKDLGL